MDLKHITCNILRENCYLLHTEKAYIVVDPGCSNTEEFTTILKAMNGRKPNAILLTHGHFDHTIGVVNFQKVWPDVPVYMGAADAVMLQENPSYSKNFGVDGGDYSFKWLPVADGDEFCFGDDDACAKVASDNASDAPNGEKAQSEGDGNIRFKAIATPGHSPGGICWYCEQAGLLFSGDTLFAGTIGRTDVPHADYDSLIRSIMEKLIFLPGSTDVFPGHGFHTNIHRERTSNPFLEPFNEPEAFSPGSTLDDGLTPIEFHIK